MSILNSITALIVPGVILLAAVSALYKKQDVFSAISDGAAEGLRVTIKILPPLVGLLTAVYMLRASGAMDAFSRVCAPVLRWLGIPQETAPLVMIRPFSGSGALAIGSELIAKYGADSLVGRTAAVMLGSTETTFYTIAVYFGAVGIKKTRYAIPAALLADITGFAAAALAVRLFFPS
jgi:spore maturation protein B